MSDLYDLEAQMASDREAEDRTERARTRIAAFQSLPPEEQWQRLLTRPVYGPATRLTVRLSGRPGIHTHLQRLEDECLGLLPPTDADHLRSTA